MNQKMSINPVAHGTIGHIVVEYDVEGTTLHACHVSTVIPGFSQVNHERHGVELVAFEDKHNTPDGQS